MKKIFIENDSFGIIGNIFFNTPMEKWLEYINSYIKEESGGYISFGDYYYPITKECLSPNYRSKLRKGDIILIDGKRYIIYSLPEFDPETKENYDFSNEEQLKLYINRIFDHGNKYIAFNIDQNTGLIKDDIYDNLYLIKYDILNDRNSVEEEFYKKYILNKESLSNYIIGLGYE